MEQDFLRLIYPQWQGGNIASWFPDFEPQKISVGYSLGAELLNFLCPYSSNVKQVPVSLKATERGEKDGILDKIPLCEQIACTLDILRTECPNKVLTLGGDCSVSVPVFSYLASKSPENTAIIWMDAHPDITLPGDAYNGFHAMALSACLGEGDPDILSLLPGKVLKENVLTLGVRNFERNEIVERFNDWGITNIGCAELEKGTAKIEDWLRTRNIENVLVHLDLDVLEPSQIQAAVGRDPHGLTIKTVLNCISAISKKTNIIGLTIAEPMPRTAILLKEMLNQLPLTHL